jgi:hypothetical protein
MAVHDLIGSYIRLKYSSPFAPHVMTIPMNTWNGSDSSLDPGLFTCWDASTRAGGTVIMNFVAALAPMFGSDSTFNQGEIWTRPSMDVEPRLRWITSLAVPGSSELTGWEEAVQRTYFFRDTANAAYKLVLLDTPTDNNFGKYYTVTSDETAIINFLTADDYPFATRNRLKPAYFRSLTVTLNERLRREYHLR